MATSKYYKESRDAQINQFAELVHELLGTYLFRSIYLLGRQTSLVSELQRDEAQGIVTVLVRNSPSPEEFQRWGCPQSVWRESFFYVEVQVKEVGDEVVVAIPDFKLPTSMQRQRRFKTLLDVVSHHIRQYNWSTELDMTDNSEDYVVTELVHKAGLTIRPE